MRKSLTNARKAQKHFNILNKRGFKTTIITCARFDNRYKTLKQSRFIITTSSLRDGDGSVFPILNEIPFGHESIIGKKGRGIYSSTQYTAQNASQKAPCTSSSEPTHWENGTEKARWSRDIWRLQLTELFPYANPIQIMLVTIISINPWHITPPSYSCFNRATRIETRACALKNPEGGWGINRLIGL